MNENRTSKKSKQKRILTKKKYVLLSTNDKVYFD